MENVMLNGTQTQIKIVDFGLSNVWSNDNPLRTHCGSPDYAAPELFIAGKEYGPEVDLWSLGIIFYGMVVGQLPFIGGRKTELSSQERRKRLVAQINKGLGTFQRQAIASLSPEFRAMMNKLLIADPAKRITIKELIVHPWITEKGRKFVQTHPFKSLDNQWQEKYIKEIGNCFKMDTNATLSEISKNPYGRLGGMLNILTFKHINEPFHPDHIAPIVTKTNKLEISSEMPFVKPKLRPKSHSTLYNQCIVLLNKVSKQQIEGKGNDRAKTAGHPITLATNLTKLSRNKMNPLPEDKQNSNRMNVNEAKRIESSTTTTVKKSVSTRLRSAGDQDCQISNKKRPHTTGTVQQMLTRQNKKISGNSKCPDASRQQVCLNSRGMGDGSSVKPQISKTVLQRSKGPLANDPIARSIAGYLVKNIPDNMFHMKMRK